MVGYIKSQQIMVMMSKYKITLAGFAAWLGLKKAMIKFKFKNIPENALAGYWPFLNLGLLAKYNKFLARCPDAFISPAPGAVFRLSADESQHALGRALDVMLPITTLDYAFEVAKEVGFTGIGLYPDWTPYKGIHLDVRLGRTPGKPAKWAGIKQGGKQIYVAVNQVIGSA